MNLTLTIKALRMQVALIIQKWMQNMNLIFTFSLLLLQEIFPLAKFFFSIIEKLLMKETLHILYKNMLPRFILTLKYFLETG